MNSERIAHHRLFSLVTIWAAFTAATLARFSGGFVDWALIGGGAIALAGLSLAFVLAYASPTRAMIYTLSCVALSMGLEHVRPGSEQHWALTAAVVMYLSMLSVLGFWEYFLEAGHRERIANAVSAYVPHAVMGSTGRVPVSDLQVIDNRDMTVMFIDLRGFTKLSEHMQTRDLVELLNQWFSRATRVLVDHRATIDKYIGDAIMAFWGAPDPNTRHATDAVGAARAVLAELAALNAEFATKGRPTIACGIGVCTGRMVVGHIGSEHRRQYTAVGDQVNLASRLQSETRRYHYPVIVNDRCRAEAHDWVFQELAQVRVRGRIKPARIYTPVCRKSELDSLTAERLSEHHEALSLYYQGDWERALSRLQDLAATAKGHEQRYYEVLIAAAREQSNEHGRVAIGDTLPPGAITAPSAYVGS